MVQAKRSPEKNFAMSTVELQILLIWLGMASAHISRFDATDCHRKASISASLNGTENLWNGQAKEIRARPAQPGEGDHLIVMESLHSCICRSFLSKFQCYICDI